MRVLITGGAGFIGSHLVDRLLRDHDVVVLDNLSLGKEELLNDYRRHPRFTFVEGDVRDAAHLDAAIRGCDAVAHLAANSDIRAGTRTTDVDLQHGVLATYQVLEAMRRHGVSKIWFTSSSVVYGVPTIVPTPEDYGPLLPISLYGASKLAAEGLISAFAHLYDIQAWIFRCANVVGSRMTHGALYDFVKKLHDDPTRLTILGDGNQCKVYLHVEDCLDGMLFAVTHAEEPVNVLNLSTDDAVVVRRMAEMVVHHLGLAQVAFQFTGTPYGWKGDVPRVGLDTTKMKTLGWAPRLNSEQAVASAIEALTPCRW
ncbi:MAG: SDR family NAD(P)-dependent oxidoreductase [Candidatus Omnitrophica bacterium]|nr:SDR family NAD(P)-dependent oxidoreductase [Candidatus Omnitrophota bacterium]